MKSEVWNGSRYGSRDNWPKVRVDMKEEKDENQVIDHTVVETMKPTKKSLRNKKVSFLYQPESYDEKMYATYLKQKIVYTREYPYAKSIKVLTRKGRVKNPDEELLKKPNPLIPVNALLCCLPIGLFSLLHYMRALSAYVRNSELTNCRYIIYRSWVNSAASSKKSCSLAKRLGSTGQFGNTVEKHHSKSQKFIELGKDHVFWPRPCYSVEVMQFGKLLQLGNMIW